MVNKFCQSLGSLLNLGSTVYSVYSHAIMLSYALFNFNEEITGKRQNHSFLMNKFTFYALYQTLQTTKLNFEKLLG